MISIKAPRYFPKVSCSVLMGFVNSSSSVPAFFSSLKLRIVTAGIRKIKIHGAIWKKGARSAKPLLDFRT